jgi:hypothetical protein
MDERVAPSLEAEGIPDHEGPLPEKAATGDAQEGIYPPQDHYVGAEAHGVTVNEAREGASLDERLAAEQPDPALEEVTELADPD